MSNYVKTVEEQNAELMVKLAAAEAKMESLRADTVRFKPRWEPFPESAQHPGSWKLINGKGLSSSVIAVIHPDKNIEMYHVEIMTRSNRAPYTFDVCGDADDAKYRTEEAIYGPPIS